MSRLNDSPRVIGSLTYEELHLRPIRKDRSYSKTITVTTGGFLDSLTPKERDDLIGSTSQAALEYEWDVRIEGQRWPEGSIRRPKVKKETLPPMEVARLMGIRREDREATVAAWATEAA